VQRVHLQDVKDNLLVGSQGSQRNVNLVRQLPSRTIQPPDPIIKAKALDVGAWYLNPVFVCAPFDVDSSFLPFCPQCGCTRYSYHGWSGFRRVVDVDRLCYAISRRYLCTSDSCGAEYLGWDEAITARTPAHIRLLFPVILTHRLAVTEAVFDLMRSCLDAGTGPGPFAHIIQEHHLRRYDRCRLAYMARVSALRKSPQSGQTSMHGPQLNQEPPKFSAFDDPEGFGGIRVTSRYLRALYTFCMGMLEARMKQKNAMVSAQILSGDHFFKILRCNFTFGGSRSFEAAYSLVNEHSEIVAVVLTQSKTLEEVRPMLVGVAKRMVALGHAKDHITLFYTDNPVAEKKFLLSIFDGLSRGENLPPALPFLELPPGHKLYPLVKTVDVNRFVRLVRDDLATAAAAGRELVISLDTEWTVSGHGQYRRSAPTEVVQISTATRTLVIHVARTGFPHELIALLSDPSVLKVGRGIAGDVKRLECQSVPVRVCNIKDVGTIAKELGLVPRANMSLATLCEQVLGLSLDKTEQVGYWGGDLTDSQIRYAAKDAYACWSLYKKMMADGSRFIDADKLTPGAQVIVMDASGTEAVAKATIAADQPAPPARRVAKAKKRVSVIVAEVLVPAFVLPFSRSSPPAALGDVWHDSEIGGPRATFEVPCSQLRDAKHPMEVRAVRLGAERPRVPTIGRKDGVFDARAEVELDAGRLQAMVSAGGAATWDEDDGSDAEEGEEPGDTLVQEEDDLPELDVGLLDATDSAVSGVKADPMHVMDRVLRMMPKNHGALGLFSRRLSQAMMLSNLKDALAAKAVAANLWPNTPWAEILFRRRRWLNKRVRRFIPAPDILVARLEAVFDEFKDIVDASTSSPLFTPNALKAYKAVIKLARSGAVSDDLHVPMYSLLALDKDKLPLWLCSRGTNVNEGGVHQKLVKNFLSMKGASPELVYFALLEWVHRNNVRAAARNRGFDFPGHYDTWLVDALCKLEEELYGVRVSFPSWQCADDYSLPPFCCGVMQMEQSVLNQLGLPVGNKLEKARTLLERVSSQKKWLSRAMGSDLPLIPVHTVDEIKMYHNTHKRLIEEEEKRRLSASAGVEVVVMAADCEPSIERLTVAINQAVTARWMELVAADNAPAPSVFFKSFDHVRMYQARFEKSRNVMSTLIVHSQSLRRDIIASGQGYIRFGPVASTVEAVHPPQSSSTAAETAASRGGDGPGSSGGGSVGASADSGRDGSAGSAGGQGGCGGAACAGGQGDAATVGRAQDQGRGGDAGRTAGQDGAAAAGRAGRGDDGGGAGRASGERAGGAGPSRGDHGIDTAGIPTGAMGVRNDADPADDHTGYDASSPVQHPTHVAAILPQDFLRRPVLTAQLPPGLATTLPFFSVGVVGQPSASGAVSHAARQALMLQMLPPAVAAPPTALGTVAAASSRGRSAPVVGAAASANPLAALTAAPLAMAAGQPPTSVTSTYQPLPKRKKVRHCVCGRASCPGSSNRSRCPHLSGHAEPPSSSAPTQPSTAHSPSLLEPYAPAMSDSSSTTTDEEEPPSKTPRSR